MGRVAPPSAVPWRSVLLLSLVLLMFCVFINLLIGGGEYVYHGVCGRVRGQPRELILSFWGLNSNCQTWQQEPLPAEPFGLPTID